MEIDSGLPVFQSYSILFNLIQFKFLKKRQTQILTNGNIFILPASRLRSDGLFLRFLQAFFRKKYVSSLQSFFVDIDRDAGRRASGLAFQFASRKKSRTNRRNICL